MKDLARRQHLREIGFQQTRAKLAAQRAVALITARVRSGVACGYNGRDRVAPRILSGSVGSAVANRIVANVRRTCGIAASVERRFLIQHSANQRYGRVRTGIFNSQAE